MAQKNMDRTRPRLLRKSVGKKSGSNRSVRRFAHSHSRSRDEERKESASKPSQRCRDTPQSHADRDQRRTRLAIAECSEDRRSQRVNNQKTCREETKLRIGEMQL